MGQSTSCFFLFSCDAFSASFIWFANSRSVSSISSKPSGGGLRFRAVRTGGILARFARVENERSEYVSRCECKMPYGMCRIKSELVVLDF
jgi:hypothetical protein